VRARGLKLSVVEGYTDEFPSRPVRARGLKHLAGKARKEVERVAPRAGAWIETQRQFHHILQQKQSRPVRARGLKPATVPKTDEGIKSRPVRARGLKRYIYGLDSAFDVVAPRAGAWIETNIYSLVASFANLSRPVRARGLKQIRQVVPRR